jgi:hypothetical protein
MQPKTKEELTKLIKDVWEELNQESLNRLVLNFQLRIGLLFGVRGQSFSLYLSSHRTEPRIEDTNAIKHCAKFLNDHQMNQQFINEELPPSDEEDHDEELEQITNNPVLDQEQSIREPSFKNFV